MTTRPITLGVEKMAGLSGINKLNWNQVGRVTEPGRYQYTFGWLTVGAEDVAIWEQYPNKRGDESAIQSNGDDRSYERFHSGNPPPHFVPYCSISRGALGA
jgi:hypothetical protein